jgi:hypothetical protein
MAHSLQSYLLQIIHLEVGINLQVDSESQHKSSGPTRRSEIWTQVSYYVIRSDRVSMPLSLELFNPTG